MSYKDKTWCEAGDTCACAEGCHRVLTDEERIKAILWWGGHDVPIMTTEKLDCYISKEYAEGKEELVNVIEFIKACNKR